MTEKKTNTAAPAATVALSAATSCPLVTDAQAPAVVYPLKIRGTLTQLSQEGDCEFRAQRSTGESSQQVRQSTRQSKLYDTVATKGRPKLVAHLSCSADSADPYSELRAELETLISRDDKGSEMPKVAGRYLLKKDYAQVRYNQQKAVVDVQLQIDLKATRNIQTKLITLMQEISTCLATNQQCLSRHAS